MRSNRIDNNTGRAFLISILSALFAVTSVIAEEITQPEKIKAIQENQNKYFASFFEQYLPQNALEMIERLPGFKFDQGENNRGFGGNAGNVLIDGARPTSKSGGLGGVLRRIPAAQVDYIEIIRGGVSGGDASGQSIVANVIRKKSVSSGTWAAKIRRAPDGKSIPNIEAAINTTLGDWVTAFDIDIGGFPGYRTALIETRDSNTNLERSSNETFAHSNKWFFSNGEGSSKLADGLFTVNAKLGVDKGDFDTIREIFIARLPDTGNSENGGAGNENPDSRLKIAENSKFKLAELGLDWVATENDWKLHLIGLLVVNEQEYANEVNFEDLALEVNNTSSRFSQDSDKNEMITRATYGFSGKSKFKPEYGIEIASNELSSLTNNSGQIEIVKVEELRSEVFTSFTYQASKKLSIEGGLISEFSQIEVSGESANKQSFQFIKPRLSINYKINKSNQLSLNAERKVGQLNFRDFAASNNAADNNLFSGNPNLAPDTSDELSATYDWSFSEKGSFKVNLFHHWKQDILEQIILSEEGEEQRQGLGNAGDATFWGINTDLNLPLDWILDNGLIEISHVYADSKFNDPVINGNRTINGYIHNWLTFKLRQDLVKSKIAWGVEYWGVFEDTNFSVNERVTFGGNDRFKIFIETSKYFGVKIQLEIAHLNTGDYTRSRFIHQGDRSQPLSSTQIAYRHREPEIKLSVFGSF